MVGGRIKIGTMRHFVVLYIIVNNLNLSNGELNLKTYNFDSQVNQLIWNHDKETLTVSTVNGNMDLNRKLESASHSINNANCPTSHVKCIQRRIDGDHVLTALHHSQMDMLDCKNEKVLFCKKQPNDKSWVLDLYARHTSESKCVKKPLHRNETAKNSRDQFNYTIVNAIVERLLKSELKPPRENDQQSKFKVLCAHVPDKANNIYFTSSSPDDRFIYGFLHNEWAYIVFVDTSTGRTKILRVCDNVDGLLSYTYVTIACEDEYGQLYESALSAHFSGRSEHLTTNNIMKNESLFVNFEMTNEDGYSTSYNTVMCMFALKKIESAFHSASNSFSECYVPKVDKIETVNKSTGNADSEKKQNPKCGNVAMLKGKLMVVDKEKGTSLAVSIKEDEVVALIGTTEGNIQQYYLRKHWVSTPVYNTSLSKFVPSQVRISDYKILRSNALDNYGNNLYLLTGNTVIRYPVSPCIPHPTPKSCLHSTMDCGWCEGLCAFRQDCKGKFMASWTEYSQHISVKLVSPFSGPLQGGTVLTLKGIYAFYEQTPREEQIQFYVGDVNCELGKWENLPKSDPFSWRVQCTTGAHINLRTDPVMMTILGDFNNGTKGRSLAKILTEETFSYVEPKVYGIKPGHGPIAGGTNITIFGGNLNSGSNLSISIAGVNCTVIEKHVQNISCTTGSSKKEKKGLIRIWIDGNLIKTTPLNITNDYEHEFQYKSNPSVTWIFPTRAIFSGGTNVTVNGSQFDSVAYPQIMVTVSVNGDRTQLLKTCYHTEDYKKSIACEVPSLAIDAQLPQPTASEPLQTELSFIFDGVPTDVLYQHLHQPPKYMFYFPDPTFDVMDDAIAEESLGSEIVFKGYNLDVILKPRDIKIMLNETLFCPVVDLKFTELRCSVDTKSLATLKIRGTGKVYPIRTRVGNRRYILGHVYLSPHDSAEDILLALCILLSVILVILLAVFAGMYFARNMQPTNALRRSRTPARERNSKDDNLDIELKEKPYRD